jgi:hypothetical protein
MVRARVAPLLVLALLAPTAEGSARRIAPSHGVVTVDLDPAQAWVRGTVQWRLPLPDSVRTLWFDAESLTVSRVLVTAVARRRTVSWAQRGDSLLVDAIGGLPAGTVLVEVGFEAPWRSARGWVRAGTGGRAEFAEGGARRALPCVDDSSRTRWHWHVQVPHSHRVRSPMTLLRRQRDRTVEVSEWRSPRPQSASLQELEVRRRVRP